MKRSDYSRIADVAKVEEPRAARRISGVIKWAEQIVIDDIRNGGTGENGLNEVAHLMQPRLVVAHTDSAVKVAMGAFKIARALTAVQSRQNVMVRGKAEMAVAFNDDALIQRYAEIRIEDWLSETASLETETSITNLLKILRDGWALGADGQNARADIGSVIKYFHDAVAAQTEARAVLMARTSMIWAANDAAQVSYAQSGVTQKEWMTAEDELLCPFCAALDGKRIGLDAQYASKGDVLRGTDAGGRDVTQSVGIDVAHPPAHPHCRCTLVPVL